MLDKLKPYRKLIVAIIGSGLTWAVAEYAGDPDISKWLSLATAILTAAGVYQAKNEA